MASAATPRLLGVAVVVVAVLCGCGEATPDTRVDKLRPDELDAEQATVVRELKRMDTAMRRERYGRACTFFTAGAQGRLIELTGAASCLAALALVDYFSRQLVTPEQYDKLARQPPKSIDVSGDTATVRFGPAPRSLRDELGREGTDVELVRVDGRWLIRDMTGLETGTVV